MKHNYYYRLDQNNKPIPGSLERRLHKPKTGKWGQILKEDMVDVCCIQEGGNIGIDERIQILGPTGNLSGRNLYITFLSEINDIDSDEISTHIIFVNNVAVNSNSDIYLGANVNIPFTDPTFQNEYYSIAILKSGEIIKTKKYYFTISDNLPVFSTLSGDYIMKSGDDGTMHIMDYVKDIDPGDISGTDWEIEGLPFSCSVNMTPFSNVEGGFMLFDITMNILVGWEGTYNMTIYVNRGTASEVSKSLNVIVDTNNHYRILTRTAIQKSVGYNPALPMIPSNAGTITNNIAYNSFSSSGHPNTYNMAFSGFGPGTVNYNISNFTHDNLFYIVQQRNNSTSGGRMEDSVAFIIDAYPQF